MIGVRGDRLAVLFFEVHSRAYFASLVLHSTVNCAVRCESCEFAVRCRFQALPLRSGVRLSEKES